MITALVPTRDELRCKIPDNSEVRVESDSPKSKDEDPDEATLGAGRHFAHSSHRSLRCAHQQSPYFIRPPHEQVRSATGADCSKTPSRSASNWIGRGGVSQ